jgi:glycosyltransferase involved in cell wall biosynthesis
VIVLTMIVRNEAQVIRRCLESVRPFVDAWVISDTGSTDETEKIVLDVMGDLPGRLMDREWVDFGTNRNQVLERARAFMGELGKGPHYALTIDADEMLRFSDVPTIKEGPTHPDAFTLDVEYAGTRYRRTSLIRLDRPWRWVGLVHEYLDMGEPANIGHLTAPTVRVFHEGARSRDPETYAKDAYLLEEALAEDPLNPRWQFYVAQSYRDAGRLEAAAEAYLIRAENPGGWWEERWYAGFQHGVMVARLGGDPTTAYLAAFAANPKRAEPLVELATWLRLQDRFAEAAVYALAATEMTVPSDGLFIDSSAHARAQDELAVSSYWCEDPFGRARYAAFEALAASPSDPRLVENLRMCEEKFG